MPLPDKETGHVKRICRGRNGSYREHDVRLADNDMCSLKHLYISTQTQPPSLSSFQPNVDYARRAPTCARGRRCIIAIYISSDPYRSVPGCNRDAGAAQRGLENTGLHLAAERVEALISGRTQFPASGGKAKLKVAGDTKHMYIKDALYRWRLWDGDFKPSNAFWHRRYIKRCGLPSTAFRSGLIAKF